MASYSQLAPYGGPGRRRTITAKPAAIASAVRRVDVELAGRKIKLKLSHKL